MVPSDYLPVIRLSRSAAVWEALRLQRETLWLLMYRFETENCGGVILPGRLKAVTYSIIIQYNIKTCNVPYVTRMLIVGAGKSPEELSVDSMTVCDDDL